MNSFTKLLFNLALIFVTSITFENQMEDFQKIFFSNAFLRVFASKYFLDSDV